MNIFILKAKKLALRENKFCLKTKYILASDGLCIRVHAREEIVYALGIYYPQQPGCSLQCDGNGGFQTDAADVVLKMGSGGAGGELRLHRFFLSPFLSFLLLISFHPS